ncbi:N-acetylmuramoyl-L-alanine amidase CwlD [Anaerocolumna aminovalerica]|jgi:N-acetylmuramoyl-L-alanine amidase|uniref:N-acetylmuramoyl-L-alanine amidase n=1 Tax=Anaerocolumna aminovalerica TaxID=1527 RepID=A0A1I5I2P7_9FIRM|nr:N-acetylmuramoyl-L-alanine amidase [Anaerocolumna aminovalerica]MBU5333762.1 N-acetylmuramoyl-L-alanine amidase [Anaerocolumna aminovalerica]MDU6265271.1 N-acetylmuramoyl-L-alanine amidase [Anaerocolumna aminovalerica]SFO54490.1 N-acetylmuramoyl-L-alanine amidase [Anaerocolumna aminovalerica]
MNPKKIQIKKYFNLVFLIMAALSIYILAEPSVGVMQDSTARLKEDNKKRITVVIDPGHGGFDPGKVGLNDSLEKDINLSISLKLKTILEQNDINVIMTREEDKGLYSESDSSKKAADLRNRVEIINNSDAVVAVSIHQNSFGQESIKGAQVFYYSNSEEGKEFAELMQEQLKKSLNDGNKRLAKSNSNYYMLKKSNRPLIIIECGFLSNYTEAALLLDETYQEKLAWSIHLGILSYINQSTKDAPH